MSGRSELSRILTSHAGVSKHVQKAIMARLKKENPKMYVKVVKAQSSNNLLPLLRGEMSAREIISILRGAMRRQQGRALRHWRRTCVELEQDQLVANLQHELHEEKNRNEIASKKFHSIIEEQNKELDDLRANIFKMGAAERDHENKVCRRVCIRLLKSKLSAGWDAWTEYDRIKVILIRVAARWMKKSMVRCFNMWSHNVAESRRLRALCHKISRRWLRSGLFRVFTRWREYAVEEIRLRGVCLRVVKKILQRQIRQCFESWSDNVMEIARQRALCARIAKRWQQAGLVSALNRWREWADQRLHDKHVVRRWLNSIENRDLLSGWRTWILHNNWMKDHEHYSEVELLREEIINLRQELDRRDQQANKVRTRVIGRMRVRFVAPKFLCWKKEVEESIRLKSVCQRVIARMLMRQLAGCFATWSDTVEENKRLKMVGQKVIKRMLMRQLAGCFTTWLETVTENIRLRNICQKVIKRILMRQLAGCFSTWWSNAHDQVVMRMVESKVVIKLRRRMMQSLFQRWLLNIHEIQRFKILSRRAMNKKKYRCVVLLRSTLRRWRLFSACKIRGRSIVARLHAQQSRRLLQHTLLEWSRGRLQRTRRRDVLCKFRHLLMRQYHQLLFSSILKWKVQCTVIMEWRDKVKNLQKDEKKFQEELHTLRTDMSHFKQKGMLQKGEILELTVEKRKLLTRLAKKDNEHQTNLIEAKNEGIAECRLKFHRLESQWLKKGRLWSMERTRLKLEMETMNSGVLSTQTEKHQIIRDLDVSNAKQKRMARKAKEFRNLAHDLQKKWEETTKWESTRLEEMEDQFSLWKRTADSRVEESDVKLLQMESKYDQVKEQYNRTNNYVSLMVLRQRHHVIMTRVLHQWHSVVLGQRVGARIAMSVQHGYQRRSLLDQQRREQAEKASAAAKERYEGVSKQFIVMESEFLEKTTRMKKESKDRAQLSLQLLENLTKDRASALETAKEDKIAATIEIQMLEKEIYDLREKCVEAEAHQLTASVLEHEVIVLRDAVQAKNDEMNDFRIELEQLVKH